jgi:hypothetical protein
MRPDDPDKQPAPDLTDEEQHAFDRIIERETNENARRLLDYWARPEDLGPHAGRLLAETFTMLWRRPTTPPQQGQ